MIGWDNKINFKYLIPPGVSFLFADHMWNIMTTPSAHFRTWSVIIQMFKSSETSKFHVKCSVFDFKESCSLTRESYAYQFLGVRLQGKLFAYNGIFPHFWAKILVETSPNFHFRETPCRQQKLSKIWCFIAITFSKFQILKLQIWNY